VIALALWIDLALALIWAAVIVFAAYRGFLRSALQVAAWLLSIVLAGVLSSMLAGPFYETFVRGAALRMIEGNIDQAIQSSQMAQAAHEILAQLPESLSALAQMAGISTADLIANLQAHQVSAANAAQMLEQTIVAPIATAVIRLLLALVLFIVLLVVTRLLGRKVAKLAKLPLIKQTDRILGGVLGLLKGALLLFALALALRAAAALGFGGAVFAGGVEDSYLVNVMEWIIP